MPDTPRLLTQPGATVEVTTKTLHGRFLLRPSPTVKAIVVGVLARAQRLYDVAVHYYVALSNHTHLLLTPRDQEQLSKFMQYVNSNIAREIGRLHGWDQKFWAREYKSVELDGDDETQIQRLVYLIEQGCKEGLILSPLDWPGASPIHSLVDGHWSVYGIWTDRTQMYRDRQRRRKVQERDYETQLTLELTPIPAWKDRSEQWIRNWFQETVRNIEARTKRRHEERGTRPLGPEAVRSQRPTARPRKTKRAYAPRFHASSRRRRRELREAFSRFLAAYRRAAEHWKAGRRDRARFPPGCFPPRGAFVPWPEPAPGTT